MSQHVNKDSNTRLYIAGALFLTSIAASFLFSYFSNTGAHYWVAAKAIPEGVQITAGDIESIKANLGSGIDGYISSNQSPIGSITVRRIVPGELLSLAALSEESVNLNAESLAIPVRRSDLPESVAIGALVSIYQIHDSRNGEVSIPPVRVASGVFVSGISSKSANFGSDVSLTLTLARDEVPALLEASSSGRLVVVASHG